MSFSSRICGPSAKVRKRLNLRLRLGRRQNRARHKRPKRSKDDVKVMVMRYEVFIALRYLRAKRRQAVLSIITFISMLGIAVGVWALVIVLAFQSGMEQDLQNKILGGTAHLNLLREDEGPIQNPQDIVARL